jgi:putative nucleotidyltransferase with HDIG domain
VSSAEKIDALLSRMGELPTIRSVARTIGMAVNNPNTSAADIAAVIGYDQVLSAKVLQVVNSAYFGFSRRVADIRHAVALLGLDDVRRLVLAVAVIDLASDGKSRGIDVRAYWKHSIATAASATAIARVLLPAVSNDAFIAGLLHDIGKLVLMVHHPEEFCKVVALVEKHGCNMIEAEREVFEFHHAMVGAALCQRWGFPPILADAVRYHHAPMSCDRGWQLPAVVGMGDTVAYATLVGSGGNVRLPPCNEAVVKALGLKANNIERIFSETFIEIKKAEVFFEMID